MDKLKKLRNAFITGRTLDSENISADQPGLRRMLTSCPACERTLTGHSYAQFAITIATEEHHDRTIQLFEALKEHRWTDAIRFQEFDARYNAAEALALRCPSGATTVVIVRNPEELWESNSIVDHEVLDMEAGQRLNQVIESGKWHELQH